MDARLSKIILSGDVSSFHAVLTEDPCILNKAELAPTSETPLHIAALAGKTELAKEIIALKPDFVRQLNQDGFTPLHIASATGNLDIVRVLLSLSSDLCMLKDKGGRTPLHYAAIKGRVEIIREMLSRYPQALQERTALGETALHLAVMNCQFDAMKMLVEKAGDGDAYELIKDEDDYGNTILQLAVASKQLQVLDFLKSRNIVANSTTIEVLSGAQFERKTNAAPKASQTNNWGVKTDWTRQSAQSAEHSSSRSMWSKEDCILVVAILIATVTYQACLSPPHAIWNDELKLHERCRSHHSFFSSIQLCPPVAYYLFMTSNTTGFFASVLLMFRFTKPLYVRVLLPIALLSIFVTYVTLSITMSPNAISFLAIYAITIPILIYCILAAGKVRSALSLLLMKRSVGK